MVRPASRLQQLDQRPSPRKCPCRQTDLTCHCAGELDRIRSGYYPSLFYPKIGKLAKNLLPQVETIFYIHNFKGSGGGAFPIAVQPCVYCPRHVLIYKELPLFCTNGARPLHAG